MIFPMITIKIIFAVMKSATLLFNYRCIFKNIILHLLRSMINALQNLILLHFCIFSDIFWSDIGNCTEEENLDYY